MSTDRLREDISEEVERLLSPSFSINVTTTGTVPHSDDVAVTFPNLDDQSQACKLIETCILYIDIRRSTELSLAHRPKTVSKLYSAFVRAMTRCARHHSGHVRGIIGDRVMVIFDRDRCFDNAVKTAVSMNSVAEYIINKHFKADEVRCGIGIDYGKMLVTKTGVRRNGQERHNYRNLVWLGHPANIASKLTDIANKPSEYRTLRTVHVARDYGAGWQWSIEFPEVFVQSLKPTYCPTGIQHADPRYGAFFTINQDHKIRDKIPSILITRAVYDGFIAQNPSDPIILKKLFNRVPITLPSFKDAIYGGNIIWTNFRDSAL